MNAASAGAGARHARTTVSLWLAFVVTLASAAHGELVVSGAPPAARLPQGAATPRMAASGAIRGRVVHAETGAPLARALVTLAGEPSIQRQVTTDRDGRYEFAEVRPGRFMLTASKGGYLSLQYGQRRPFEPGRPVTVSAARVLAGMDLALPRASVIAGRVTDERGEPVVGATITVERYQYAPGGQRRLTRAPTLAPGTNDLGEFRAFGLMPGEYVVSAQVPQMPLPPGQTTPIGGTVGFLPTYYPGTANAAEAQAVTVVLGQEAFVQFSMTRGRLSRITGTVTDSSGRPASGASLMLATPAANAIGASGRSAGSVAADGAFGISNVTPGDHFIQVRLGAPPGGEPEVANARITTAGEDVAGFRITTTPGTTVEGRVEWDGTAPRTGSDTLRIAANPADGRPALIGSIGLADPHANGTVRPDGTFRIAAIIGPVVLAPAGVPPRWTLKAIVVDGTDVTTSGVDPASFGIDTRVRVVLTDKVTELSGTVRNAQGERHHEYVVVVLPERPVESAVASRYTRTARPDQQGGFRIRDLPPGRYVAVAVSALEEGSEWDPVFQAAVRPSARPFTLAEGQSLTLDLELQP